MDNIELTEAKLAELSAQIDEQLLELSQLPSTFSRGVEPRKRGLSLPEKQSRALEQATGEPGAAFLQRFAHNAVDDLCNEGGVLHTQWQKWKDLATKDLIGFVSGILVGMGLSGNALYGAVVAVCVIILHLGIKTICEEWAKK